MDWIAQNNRDVWMLRLVDLSPLDAAHAAGDKPLVQLVERHNAALAELTKRMEKLAADREAMASTDRWLHHDAATIIAEHRP